VVSVIYLLQMKADRNISLEVFLCSKVVLLAVRVEP